MKFQNTKHGQRLNQNLPHHKSSFLNLIFKSFIIVVHVNAEINLGLNLSVNSVSKSTPIVHNKSVDNWHCAKVVCSVRSGVNAEDYFWHGFSLSKEHICSDPLSANCFQF